jgi:hypothetical protein
MINQKTVLILGAGASMPFGFPSGSGLIALISQMLEPNRTAIPRLLIEHGYEKQIKEFKHDLIHSGRSSVDEFLEYRTEFLDIGKETIAAALLEFEQTHTLFNVTMNNNWYQHLFSLLNISFDEFDQNKLAIITFNYDRSLEHYFFTALQSSYGKSIEECAEKLGKIPIIHVYGKLGRLPWEKSKYAEVPYDIGPQLNKRGLAMRDAGKSINIIRENIEGNEEFNQAHQLINEAHRIYFLGFGYHPTNLNRLIGNLSPRPDLVIGGTMYNMSLSSKNTAIGIIEKFGPHMLFPERNFHNEKIYEYLYNYVAL